MKIAIVTPSPVPFAIGGAEKLFIGMLKHFNSLTVHDVELIKLPCMDQEFWSLMECYERFSRLNLNHFDAVVTTKYPAWMVHHRNHILYLQHTCRGVYDLYDENLGVDHHEVTDGISDLDKLSDLLDIDIPDRLALAPFFRELWKIRSKLDRLPPGLFDFPGPLTRAVIHFLDRVAMGPGEISSYNAISKTVASRRGYFPPSIPVKVIHHPSDLEDFHTKEGEYIFTASRLEDLKRIDLLIEAFGMVDTEKRFLIAGTGGQRRRFEEMAKGDERIEFVGFVTDAELLEHYASSIFVPFVPYDEDYGLITIEAMSSSKAVLTATDSGGVAEMVEDGVTGRVVAPDASSLAGAMQEMLDDPGRCREMGAEGRRRAEMITWTNLAEALFGEESVPQEKRVERVESEIVLTPPSISRSGKRVLHLSTFPVYPPVSGGQSRIYHLAGCLSSKADVTILSLGHRDDVRRLSESLVEVEVARPASFFRVSSMMEESSGISSEDSALIEMGSEMIRFPSLLERYMAISDMVVLEGPYHYPLVKEIASRMRSEGMRIPEIVYDAHNVESELKKSLGVSGEILSIVEESEKSLYLEADSVVVCSERDAKEFGELYGKRETIFVPNGVERSSMTPLDRESRAEIGKRLGLDGVTAIFTASRHAPNVEALRIVEECAMKVPDVTFIVIGSVGEEVSRDDIPNMIVTGVIDGKSKNLLCSIGDIGLNPITTGSGSNLKLIEYLAWGMVTLTTPFGARGFDLTDGEEIVLADVEEFAERVAEISSDMERYEEMRRRAVSGAERFDWCRISKPFIELLK
jgi:glycosyltransferase involved in cell wall biosynthesis